MKFNLDENLGLRGASILRNAGHDVETVVSQRLMSTGDHDLIRICADEGRCLITLDLDFANTHVFDPATYNGIAVLRMPDKITVSDIEKRINTLLAALTLEAIEGRLWIIEENRIRIYDENYD